MYTICSSLVAQMVNHLPAVRETWVQSLGWEDPWVGNIPWRRNWQPTPYSCLENPMDGGAWWATVNGVAKSWTE